ncbi:tRNA (cytidine32/uridine32-2'-O)-methyltransferase [Glaciecola punicea ACAM 611]|jgi:tRNA (cytidine32/uridine32-2'-O)-methyltransferase|uniref:tRNA (cytidine/uridine-2'-O-)-methyltransferase TrmJ n=1 Tax=Glaciecola punicea ACAM 611 TaxID=1121923 RepID=H5T7W9_9ALTE|nr:tRNA (cytosine(32)/uridine(32)-2'-O)-methyltransferase TrmJ [Glaciecola punicea]OFA30590.1 tRNA (cytosine(32)/uridine(32)-2'-O)-methyltransferase TrmJ [Glaciecola punicea]GAB54396.1 tRNA (cytidine32/uridine32-2'-O)-methyltransferase [Glaciecola punicea ACAM 611]
MLDAIRIVLVNTSHTGNIGSAARAMKTMGLKNLYLVDPVTKPDSKASALAAGATDILANATIVNTLQEAIADCGLVVGTSARSRTLSWPMLDSRECGDKLITEAANYPVALVFGRENNGLSNEELQQCNFHVCIDANPEYSSLNLAAAVQTLCYEIRQHHIALQRAPYIEREALENPYPLSKELEKFYVHFESTFAKAGFIRSKHPGVIMSKVRRMFTRTRLESQELAILRGMLSAVDKTVSESKKD